jgi:hypothetical protein
MSSKLELQFFPERLALLEAFEELFEDADDNRVYADAFRFGPLLERGPGLCADMKKLRIGKLQTRFASLVDLQLFPINLTQGEKYNPGQVALHARLLRDCFSEINWQPERHSGLGCSLVLHFLDRTPGFPLHCHKWTSRLHTAFP